MRYSLYSRFRGTLLGAVLGETLGTTLVKTDDTEWGRIGVLVAQSLIRLGRFDVDDWRDMLLSTSTLRLFHPSSDLEAMNCISTKAIIATLPLALFYHENEIKLRHNLQLFLVTVGQDDSVSRDGALAVGYAIAQSLTETLNAVTLIPQIIAFLESPTQLSQQLAQVQMLLEQGAGLERAVNHLGGAAQPSNQIALAFYCFLSTLEDWRISVMRTAQKSYQPQATTAIIGALSGAYNSTAGIPATLRIVLSRSDAKPLLAWGMTTEAEMLELSDSLFTVWSGVYDQTTNLNELTPVAAISAPNVIRSR